LFVGLGTLDFLLKSDSCSYWLCCV